MGGGIIRFVWLLQITSLMVAEGNEKQYFNSKLDSAGSRRIGDQSRAIGPDSCTHELGAVVPMKALGQKKCPQSKEIVDLEMKLYTRTNPDNPHIFKYYEGSKILESKFNSSKGTRMVVHGFGGDCNLEWIIDMRKALLKESDMNVFCADWRKGTIYPDYAQGAANTQIAGRLIAIFFNAVSKKVGDIGPKLHLIGFSFGAQVCSFAGANIPNCDRITGLDPAGPSFREHNTTFRLDKSDAKFVDVIHTNGISFTKGGIGLLEESGDVDFYPFGGETQPFCNNLFEEFLTGQTFGCSHYRAVHLFMESIKFKECKMVGFPCSSGWEGFRDGKCFDTKKAYALGIDVSRKARGSLYLTTRTKAPYCGNQLKVTISLKVNPSLLGKLYSRSLEIIYKTPGEKNSESFTVARGFVKSGIYSSVMTVHLHIPIRNIYLRFTIGNFISFFGKKEKLKINFVTITNVNGVMSKWKLANSRDEIISGTEAKLKKT